MTAVVQGGGFIAKQRFPPMKTLMQSVLVLKYIRKLRDEKKLSGETRNRRIFCLVGV